MDNPKVMTLTDIRKIDTYCCFRSCLFKVTDYCVFTQCKLKMCNFSLAFDLMEMKVENFNWRKLTL